MRKPVFFLSTALAAAIAIFFVRHFEVQWGDTFEIRPRGAAAPGRESVGAVAKVTTLLTPHNDTTAIRVAGWLLDPPWDVTRIRRDEDLAHLSQVVVAGRFDVLTLQGAHLEGPKPLVPLLDKLRQTGYDYDAIDGPPASASDPHRFVVLYNRRTVEADVRETYMVPHSESAFHYPPLVTCFRARGVPADQAFTFSLISVHVDPQRVDSEAALMAPLVAAVQGDGRGEDDVLVVGNFQTGGVGLQRGLKSARLSTLLREDGQNSMMTTTDRTQQLDNIIIDTWSTTEFTGRYAVFDFLRELNLRMADARKVSDRLPIWGEFSTQEAEMRAVQ